MSGRPVTRPVLGLDVAFRAGADMERAGRAIQLVEERYSMQKSRSRGAQSKDVLLTYLVLDLADELLQLKMKRGLERERLKALLDKIEKSI